MARLVLLTCLLAFVVSVLADNKWLVVEHCSGDCSGHCGKKTSYITDKCVVEYPSSYMATCTPGGKWRIEKFLNDNCMNEDGDNGPVTESSETCYPFEGKLPVKFVSSSMVNNQVVVIVCDPVDDNETAPCDDKSCKEHILFTNTTCGNVSIFTQHYFNYIAKVTGTDDNTSTLTLALYDGEGEQFCQRGEAPVFYKENMHKDECATYTIALRGTCTNVNPEPTMTKTLPIITPTPGNITTNETTSSHAVSLATALLGVLAVVVALY